MENQILYSVIIPVFNSGNILSEINKRVSEVFVGVKSNYELILVNDGSSDPDTLEALEELEANSEIRVIHLMRNFGQQSATLCGMNEARGEYIITMDDDLQHLPENIPAMLDLQNHDVVIGRFAIKKHSFRQRVFSRLKSYADVLLLGKPPGLQLSSFRLLKREVSDAILNFTPSHPYIPALLFYVTKDIVNVDLTHAERVAGKSGYTFRKGVRLVLNLLFNNSTFLLRLIAFIGISFSLLSFLFILILVVRKFFFDVRVGWTSVIVSIFAIGGLILFAIGVTGEYLTRIISGIERRPPYIVRKKK